MSKTYVIAGNREQAEDWITSKIASIISNSQNLMYVARSNFIYVDSPLKLWGIQDPHGVFIGTWRERKDIKLVVETLFQRCIHVNRQLEMIRREVNR